MRGAIELSLEICDGEGDTKEVDSVASPSQPTWEREELIEVTSSGVRTYPEKKRHHWVKVMVLITSPKGLVRSTFSFFGTRFRKK